MSSIGKEHIGYYVFFGPKLVDVLVLPTRGPSNPVKIPLSTMISTDMIKIIAKTLGTDEINIGSISIPQYIILNGGLTSHTQWITLFEHLDDDEYDGQMGIHDDEEPRIKLHFSVSQNVPATSQRGSDAVSARSVVS